MRCFSSANLDIQVPKGLSVEDLIDRSSCVKEGEPLTDYSVVTLDFHHYRQTCTRGLEHKGQNLVFPLAAEH